MSGIFPKEAFRQYIFERPLSFEECEQKLAVLRRLLYRRADGTLAALTETRIEQSFNEQLFADLFDYRTLFQHGVGEYHLYAHKRHESERIDDLCLGFYSPRSSMALASCEHKNPGIDLEKEQSSKYGYISPVEQAFRAVSGSASVAWVIVSNFDELRLYRSNDPTHYEAVVLSEIVSHADVQRAYALFGRPHLIGYEGRPSPLLRLSNGGPPVNLPAKPSHIRIVHEARAISPTGEASFYRMDDALTDAIAYSYANQWTWPRMLPDAEIMLEEDRLVVSPVVNGDTKLRIDYAQSGIIRLQEHIEGDGELIQYAGTSHPINAVQILTDEIARRVALFARFVNRALRPVFGIKAVLKWTIHDANHLQLIASPSWTQSNLQVRMITQNELCTLPEQEWTIDNLRDDYLASQLTNTVRELFYPFLGPTGRGRPVRIKPTEQVIGDLVARLPAYQPYTVPES